MTFMLDIQIKGTPLQIGKWMVARVEGVTDVIIVYVHDPKNVDVTLKHDSYMIITPELIERPSVVWSFFEDTLHPDLMYWNRDKDLGGIIAYATHGELRRRNLLHLAAHAHDPNPGPELEWFPMWVVRCAETYGGCGMEVHGHSKEEAIAKWNRRDGV